MIDNAQIDTSTVAQGNAGEINIYVGNHILMDNEARLQSFTDGLGSAGNITLEVGGNTNLNNDSVIFTTVEDDGVGNAGNVEINTGSLFLENGSQIVTLTNGRGDAGNVLINSRDHVTLNGQSPGGFRSGIFSNVGDMATGIGGDIQINSPLISLSLANVSSASRGIGNAGNVFLNAFNRLQMNDSDITTTALQSSGGDILINISKAAEQGLVVLLGDSDITTESFGDGGNITLLGAAVIAFDDSDIIARSQSGRGGNITLTNFFSETIPPDNQPPFDGDGQVDVNADGQIAAGTINSPNTSFVENSLNELSGELVDTAALTAGSCIARSDDAEGSFVVTGGEGLPQRPGGDNIAVYPTGTVQTVAESTHAATLQEPQGVYRLADGRLVLSHECQY